MKLFFSKKIIVSLISILAVGSLVAYVAFGRGDSTKGITTEVVKQQDLKQTVLATGQVSSTTDLQLSFKGSGVVRKVLVKVGQKVTENTILANLDQRDQLATLTQARGAFAQAQANYNKVLSGASSEEVLIAQAAVDSAKVTLANAEKNLQETKQQQQTLVSNAKSALYNSTFSATPAVGTSTNLTVSGYYKGESAGQYQIRVYVGGDGARYEYSGLESGTGYLNPNSLLPLGNNGLYISIPSGFTTSDRWTIDIPNTKATTYVVNLNSYNAALETQRFAVTTAENTVASSRAALDQANAQLLAKKASARPADVAAAQAQITSASGQVQAAEAQLENTVIRAPSSGTITSIDVKVGEQSTPGKTAIVLQDIDNLHVEANISEANIANILVGQTVEFTFDALGPDRKFTGSVQLIDPASTVVSGVVNYKVTAGVDKLEEIKPGMTANMVILTNQKSSVIAIPGRAVLNKGNTKTVRVITDIKKLKYEEVSVTTGLEADGGLVEITSGLKQGQSIVTFIDTKK